MKRSKSSRILKILSYVLLITGMIVILYPFYLTIITALKTPQESSQSFFSFPQSFYLGNFVNVLQKANYFVFFRNSAVVTLVSVFLIMVLIPMCSYAIARNICLCAEAYCFGFDTRSCKVLIFRKGCQKLLTPFLFLLYKEDKKLIER